MGLKRLSIDERLTNVEKQVTELRKEFETHRTEQMEQNKVVAQVRDDLADIRSFIDGTTKVFGFARKHWKTALTFGCGLMTAAGVGNPVVIQFVQNFFGIN